MPKVTQQIGVKFHHRTQFQVPRGNSWVTRKLGTLWPPCLNPGLTAQFLGEVAFPPALQTCTLGPLTRTPLIALPSFQWNCSPLYSAPHIPSSQTRCPGRGCPFSPNGGVGKYPVRCGYSLEAALPQGCRLQGQRHLDPSSQTQTGPDKGSCEAAGQRRGSEQGSLASLLDPIPHPLAFPSLDHPILHQGLANGGVRDPSSPPTQPHPLTLLLKEPEERGKVAAQEYHHDGGRYSGRHYPDLSRMPGEATPSPQPSTKGCGPPARRPAQLRCADPRTEGGRAAPQVLLPPWPLAPPLYRPAPQVKCRGRNPL